MDRFRFVTVPFTREVRIDQRYEAETLEVEVKKLLHIVEQRQSAALIGPAGSGKTVVLRALIAALPETRYRVTYLKLADLAARDMCRQIAIGLGLPSAGTYPALVRNLEERLRSGLRDQGMRQVLAFDDAHEMRPDALRLLRLLTHVSGYRRIFDSHDPLGLHVFEA